MGHFGRFGPSLQRKEITVIELWKEEDDEESFIHSEFECKLIRAPLMKYWTGYVLIEDITHPWWGLHYAELDYVPIHGKISYADFNPMRESDQTAWWVGFNCGHPFDLLPFDYEIDGKKYPRLFKNHIYRNIDFAREQVMIIADWARKAVQ